MSNGREKSNFPVLAVLPCPTVHPRCPHNGIIKCFCCKFLPVTHFILIDSNYESEVVG